MTGGAVDVNRIWVVGLKSSPGDSVHGSAYQFEGPDLRVMAGCL
jgi:hypothetical protein